MIEMQKFDLTDGVKLEILGELLQPLDLAPGIRQRRCRRPSARRVSDAAPDQRRLRLRGRVAHGLAARLEHVLAVFGVLETKWNDLKSILPFIHLSPELNW